MAHGAPDYNQSIVAGGTGTVIQPQLTAINNDAGQHDEGDIVVWDNTIDKGCKKSILLSDPRVLGVCTPVDVPPGIEGAYYYNGIARVKVIGTGGRGNALIPSTTPGQAQSSGGTYFNQSGFIGWARESWGGPGLISTLIRINQWYAGGAVLIEGHLCLSYGAVPSGTLPGNTNPNRSIFAIVYSTENAITAAPKVAGVSMTQLGASITGWQTAGATSPVTRCYYLDDPATGDLSVDAATRSGGGLYTEFWNLSGFGSRGTLQSYVTTGAGASAACSDAYPGDLVLGSVGITNSSSTDESGYLTGSGADQTNDDTPAQLSVGVERLVAKFDHKIATVYNEQMSWSFDTSHKSAQWIIPFHPA